jgi:hypothetical protein
MASSDLLRSAARFLAQILTNVAFPRILLYVYLGALR